ncbi:MAG: hypothetical protein K6F14_06800 [Clostridiales bacterium]|nr:hypothetical protein [Clostridiales bacterium]
MPFVKAQCTNCGGLIEVDETKEAAICPFCSTPYAVEKAINNFHISNKYEIHNAQIMMQKDDVETMAADADALLYQLNKPQQAYELYKKITKLYPRDYRGWLGLAMYRIKTNNFDDEYGDIEVNLSRAKKLFPEGAECIGEFLSQYQLADTNYNKYSYRKSSITEEIFSKNPNANKNTILFVVMAIISLVIGITLRIIGAPVVLLVFSLIGMIFLFIASHFFATSKKIDELQKQYHESDKNLSFTISKFDKDLQDFTTKIKEIDSEKRLLENTEFQPPRLNNLEKKEHYHE